MNKNYLIVSTMTRCRFRMVTDAGSPQLYTGASPSPTAALREELLSATRQQEMVLRFLAEIDRKLDAVLSLLQTETLVREFPHEGHVVELGGNSLRFECDKELEQGSPVEILVMLEEYPLRIVSILAEVAQKESACALPCMHAWSYALRFLSISEDDREAVIRFVFGEERKRIRRQKGSG